MAGLSEVEILGGLLAAPPLRLYVVAAGAGATLQGRLWAVPGISSVLVGGAFPYDQDVISDFLGYRPEKYVTNEVAIDMAFTAYRKALVSKREGMPLGVGITASVAGTREHRGDHRAWIATCSPKGVRIVSVLLKKGVGFEARAADEEAIVSIALNLILHAAEAPGRVEPPIPGSESPTQKEGTWKHGSADPEHVFLNHPYFLANGTRERTPTDGSRLLLVPGAFNPVHFGHFGMADVAEETSGRRATFYITMQPPHKEAISVPEALGRVDQFVKAGRDVLFGWGDALYIDKARQFPEAAFVIGTDALDRMLDPKWCPVLPMVKEFEKLGTVFYVANRISDGKCLEFREVMMRRIAEIEGGTSNANKTLFFDTFRRIPGSWDISSTQIRDAK